MQTKVLPLFAVTILMLTAMGCGADITPACSQMMDDGICSRCLDPNDTQTCKAEQKMLNNYLQQGLDSYEQGMLCSQFRNEWYGACDACADRVSDVCQDCLLTTDSNKCNTDFIQLQASVSMQMFSTTLERNAYCKAGFLDSWGTTCATPDYCKHIKKVCDYCEVTYTIDRNGEKQIVDEGKTADLRAFCEQVIDLTYAAMLANQNCYDPWDAISSSCSYETLLSVKSSFSAPTNQE